MLANACSLALPGTGEYFNAERDGQVSVREPGPIESGHDVGAVTALDASPTVVLEKDAGELAIPDGRTDAGTDGAEPRDAAPDPAACDLNGRYALRVAFQVSWVGTAFASIVPIIDQGEGELSFTVLMELSSAQNGLSSRFRTCAAEVPEFMATISRERYQAQFTDQVWDARDMPTFASSLRTACGGPGCALSLAPFHAQIGAALSSPDAPWPSDVDSASWPDHDGDGVPGIAVTMLGPAGGQSRYAYPPLDLLSLRRVPSLGLGLRVTVGLDGELESCDALRGETVEGRVETRAVSCRAMPAPEGCQPRELQFLNENLPVWTVHEGTFEARRLARNADCQSARRAFR